MWSTYLLFILLLICVITDLKERKIYNAVLFPFLLLALILHAITGGIQGVTGAVFGMFVGLGILLIPFLLGGMGAGDVKLLAVIGGLKGVTFVLAASVFMALAGGVMAIFILFFRKGVKRRLIQIIYFYLGFFNGVRFPLLHDQEAMKTTYPYGVAIAAGAIYQAFRVGGIQI
ncbi:A24 family peptidase [Neobacillus drentensis]|uniref:A24 family peptidase n=1 Tax=Neobacillus drentensis TaxID=220684 RepID=UPI002FFE0F12